MNAVSRIPSVAERAKRLAHPTRRVGQTLARPATSLALAMLALPAAAGPFAPAADQPGSTAIHMASNAITAWATGWVDYQTGANCAAAWQMPDKALGPAAGGSYDIACLGNAGRITMTFDVFIANGPGADFTIFENGITDGFLEHAFVEVSSDGTNFVRLPNNCLTAGPHTPFITTDPTDVQGLGCKYRQGYGEPFDLDGTGADWITHVRMVDIVGDGSSTDSFGRAIYDPHPTYDSAGFDLDAIGVLNGSVWRWMRLPDLGDFFGGATNSPSLAHLPDGLFLYANNSHLWRQGAWGSTAMTQLATGSSAFDPAFIATRDGTNAIIGQGGNFGTATDLLAFDASSGSPNLTSIAQLQNFSGAYWRNAATGLDGWLVAGTHGSGGAHAVRYISLDGVTNSLVIDAVSTYSSGIAADASGNVYVAGYGGESSRDPVYRFDAAQIEAAISGSPLGPADGIRLYDFITAASMAIDAEGRIWAGGFKTNLLEIYDPETGGVATVTPDHPPIPGAFRLMYHVSTFFHEGDAWIGAIARDVIPLDATVYYLYAKAAAFQVPNTYATWCAFRFTQAERAPQFESTVWGFFADPENDGLVNGLEYAFCRDPKGPDGSRPIEANVSGGRLTIAFTRDPMNWDLDYVVEVSGSLQPDGWQEVARSAAGEPTASSGIGAGSISETHEGRKILVTVADPEIGAGRFMRVRVERRDP